MLCPFAGHSHLSVCRERGTLFLVPLIMENGSQVDLKEADQPQPKLSVNASFINHLNTGLLWLLIFCSLVVTFSFEDGFAMAILMFIVFGFFLLVIRAILEPKKFKTEEDYKLHKLIAWQKEQEKIKKWKEEQALAQAHPSQPAPLTCPKCGSQQLHSDRRGFKTGRAVGVGLLTFGIGGIVAGASGMNSIVLTCMHCGHSWKAGSRF